MLGYDLYSSALADILSEPSLSTPITVGLYAKWGSGKSFLLNKLRGGFIYTGGKFSRASTIAFFSHMIRLILCRGNEKFRPPMARSDFSIFRLAISRGNARFTPDRSDHRSHMSIVDNWTHFRSELSYCRICLPTLGLARQQAVSGFARLKLLNLIRNRCT